MTTPDDKTSEREFGLVKLYVKDLSFESPRPADALIESAYRPDVDMQLDVESRNAGDNLYEVTLNATVTAVQSDTGETVYLIEISQSGLFRIKGFTEQDLEAALNSHCPGILLPYAREVVSSVVQQGGFPQLLLKPVNFDALYHQYVKQHLQKAEAGTAG